MRGARRALGPRAALLASLGVAPAAAGAQAPPTDCAGRVRVAASHAWPSPLDRPVTVRGTTLRAALDAVAADARIRLSFSPDLLPLDRPACVAETTAPAGDALVALLAGTGVAPVPAGGAQVVLAPTRAAAASDAVPSGARPARRLERVVVTGTATGGPERASPFALSVVELGAQGRAGSQSLAGLLDGVVPGVWLWTQSPTSALARYGSVRGASSFGASAPKVYVDGIEVANPLLVTRIDAAHVASIEVIRGPQGAALYGADAIGGVVNIVTRHDGAAGGAPAEVRGSAGAASSRFVEGGVLAQEYGMALRGGAAARSASVGLTAQTLGAYVPGAAARQATAGASARWVGARAMVTGTSRLFLQRADAPASPLLTRALAGDSLPTRQATTQYTVGGTATRYGSERWTHALTAGLDGYSLDGAATDVLPVPSSADSALRAATGRADRLSLRASASRRAGDPTTRAATLTIAAEHSTVRELTTGGAAMAMALPPRATPRDTLAWADSTPRAAWWSNSGLLAQGQLAVGDRLFVTGGARVERLVGASGAELALLPMLGASLVRERGDVALKLRAAYGRGIRPARAALAGAPGFRGRVSAALLDLDPEAQSGIELGADLLVGARLGLHVTRFDQRASGLVQQVAVLDSLRRRGRGPGGPGSGDDRPEVAYLLQNVGAIDNGGWELAATSARGPLSLAATLSLVGSRVERLAAGYRGDLRVGDRMLEVPARTLGASASWAARRWSAAFGVARAADWINYDRLRLTADAAAARALLEGGANPGAVDVPVGPRLRGYWRRYDGVTRVTARVAVPLWRGTEVSATGENLLDRQTGEPDNVTVLPGRMVGVGFRTRF